jgi:lysine biosynthesis protein LysW
MFRIFSSGRHGRFWPLPSRGGSRYIILQQQVLLVPKEDSAVVRCPECASEIDVDEDEVEEGEILACPECETEMEVVQLHPVKVNAISDEDDDEEDEESEDEDELEDDDEEEEEEEV